MGDYIARLLNMRVAGQLWWVLGFVVVVQNLGGEVADRVISAALLGSVHSKDCTETLFGSLVRGWLMDSQVDPDCRVTPSTSMMIRGFHHTPPIDNSSWLIGGKVFRGVVPEYDPLK